MKITIQAEPEFITQVAQTIRRYMADHVGPGKTVRSMHRDCVVYVQEGKEPPFEYEVHVWGDDKHVRAYRFETNFK
jgi:hypothetical protein